MLNQTNLNREALQNEAIVEKRFKSMGYKAIRLDFQGKRKRPEFKIMNGNDPFLICEVKTIFSGGYSRDLNAHLSTHDNNLPNGEPFELKPALDKIDNNLLLATQKYEELTQDDKSLSGLPFLVVLFCDIFASDFDSYPSEMPRFPKISGIAEIISGREIKDFARAISSEEIESIISKIQQGILIGIPQFRKEFHLIENEKANIRLPRHFVERCFTRKRS